MDLFLYQSTAGGFDSSVAQEQQQTLNDPVLPEKWTHDTPYPGDHDLVMTTPTTSLYDSTPLSGSPASQYNDVPNEPAPSSLLGTSSRQHSSSQLDSMGLAYPASLLTPDDAEHFELFDYLVHTPESDSAARPASSFPVRDQHHKCQHQRDDDDDDYDRLHIRVIGAPDKSRVETQTRLCIQLVTSGGTKVTDWPNLKLPERLLARSRLKRAAAQQQQLQQHQAAAEYAQPGPSSGAHENDADADDDRVLHLDARVVSASRPGAAVQVCQGCIERERKRAERSKGSISSEYHRLVSEFPEQERILLFNCGPMVNFSSGDAILPTRIVCYCRHHNEKTGFRVEFTLRNSQGHEVAKGASPPILITDDHKSTRHKSRKRSRAAAASTMAESDDALHPPDDRRSSNASSSSLSLSSPANHTSGVLDFDFLGSLPANNSTRASSSCVFGNVPPSPTSTLLLGPTLLPAKVPPAAATAARGRRPPPPQVDRLVPAQGPVYGGVEVAVLGSGFYQGLTCYFGEHEAKTIFWNPSTLVCTLPPNAESGPVVVTFKAHAQVLQGRDVPLFTYHDANNQALLELALQVVGLKMTGNLHDAKHIAMRIVQGNTTTTTTTTGGLARLSGGSSSSSSSASASAPSSSA